MNAKETIKKIAEALNITDSQEEAKVIEETTPEAEVKTEEVASQVEESTPEVEEKEEVLEEAKEEVEETEVSPEAKEEEPKEEPTKDNAELEALKAQINELKSLLRTAVKEDSKQDIEVKEEEVKPLTHSPEANTPSTAKKIGGHGGDTMSRVYKYMS